MTALRVEEHVEGGVLAKRTQDFSDFSLIAYEPGLIKIAGGVDEGSAKRAQTKQGAILTMKYGWVEGGMR